MRASLRYWRRTGVYNFRPSAAKALVDRYCSFKGTVFDPCAGYGGRLLGAILSKNRPNYIGCEPSSTSFEGLHNLHQWVSSYLPEFAESVTLHKVPAEEFDFPQGVAMVLTSPPYWKRETYSDEETQSGIRYPTYNLWLEQFWAPVIRKSVEALRPGGWLILNVDNFSVGGISYPLVEDTIRLAAECGLGRPELLKYEMPGVVGDSVGSYESVLCWPKGVSSFISVAQNVSVELPRCRGCWRVASSETLHGGLCMPCLAPVGYEKVCKGCSCKFTASRRDQEFHDKSCHARWRRRLAREANPSSGIRVFTCTKCSAKWETKEKGCFFLCAKCKEEKDLEGRRKTCGYRNCGITFTDTSPKNGMDYCCVEHRRREKSMRSGIIQDASQFRDPTKAPRRCVECGARWDRSEGSTNSRCPACRDKKRHKTCPQCGIAYKDESLRNNRQRCPTCSPR
jgi:hypothetical protein